MEKLVGDLGRAIGTNQRRIRTERGLSLDALASASGVSRSNLAQIESGKANPSVATVWQIASALKVGFSELVAEPETDTHVVHALEAEPATDDDGRYRVYLVFPFDPSLGFELYTCEVDAGGGIDAAPHPAGTQEVVAVQTGRLLVDVAGETYDLDAGASIRFRADQPHGYHNPAEATTEFAMIVSYPRRT